jgi:4-hydroxy-3-methylbut-2-en-1-yl diphosphate synthase IspG/GcpE
MLSATVNAANSAQNCQNLQNSAQQRNFEIPPKIEILFFHKQKFECVEEALEHVFTVWIFNPRILYMSFLLSKNGLCM